jgi:hypothetical protein
MEMFDGILAGSKPTGDLLGIQYGLVADTKDPLGLQRIQVYDQAKGGKHKSDWLIRGLPFTSFSPPVPKVGDLVVFGYILGDPHHGCYFGCAVNNVNRPVGSEDDFTIVLGGVTVSLTTQGIVGIKGAKEVNIESTKVTVKTTGDLSLEAKDLTIKADTVKFTCPDTDFGAASSLKVSGKQIATVGAPDGRGDVLTDKGW